MRSLPLRTLSLAAVAASFAVAAPAQNSAPTAAQALALKPIQKGVEYDTPTGADAKACTVRPEREGKGTSWVVRDASGAVLRRFADSNADDVVDTWCYYAGGLEVYRDVDSDYDSRADQYRWFHTGGSRWGVDKNQDTKIDRWRQISPQEVAEEAVLAVQAKDAKRLERLLLTEEEARSLGLGKTLAERFAAGRRTASAGFRSLVSNQKAIDSKSRFVDFGAPRPGVIPAGVDGSTKDVTVYENASALVDTGDGLEQLLLGSLVRVGDGWRLVEAPKLGATGPELANVFSLPSGFSRGAGRGGPSANIQQWMDDLDKLDRQAATADPKSRGRLTDKRVSLLKNLAEASPDAGEATLWYKQLAGLLTASAQADGYDKAITELVRLSKSPGVKRVGADLEAHLRYQAIAAKYALEFRDPKADFAKVQDAWIDDLEGFVDAYAKSPESAPALVELGSMAGEFRGEPKTAEKWYGLAAKRFPKTAAGKKAAGAVQRLNSIGKRLPMSGATLSGRRVDLAAKPYAGKHVLIHYWTTWSAPETDLATIAALRKKHSGKFEVLGVNLDTDVAAAKRYTQKQGVAWEQLYDEQGIDGPRAAQLGVINLPMMLLVDDRGRVVNRNLHAGEIDGELQRLLR
ncbi:MAG: TlpA disulfide reductase family protein [Planctomycetota bacterium]